MTISTAQCTTVQSTVLRFRPKPFSACNVMSKYADDIIFLVPEHTDIDLTAEFDHVRQWAKLNKTVSYTHLTLPTILRV